MRYQLYGVEVRVSLNPEAYDLVRRVNEDGPGSPLTWPSHAKAEAYIESIRREMGEGPDGDVAGAQVVPLTGGTDREDERVLSPFDRLMAGYD